MFKTGAGPHRDVTQVIYYRTDLFQSVGLSPAEKLTDIADLCGSIDDSGEPAMAMRTAIGPTQMPFSFTAWLYNSGGTYFESYDAATNEYRDPALDSAAAADALELYTRIIQDHGPKGARNWQVSDITKAFLSGGVAMIQEGSPFGATINDPEASSVAGKVGAFAVPPGSAGQFAPSATQAWGINA